MSFTKPDLDVIVVGAGFAGLYMLHRLRRQGLAAKILESADGVGGTWYWNRYPGARCDILSVDYSYSFDKELQTDWQWSERYAKQSEILEYLNHVADRFDLRRDIQLSTRVTSARFDDATHRWEVRTEHGDCVSAQFLITAVGCLSATNFPDIQGLESFQGESFHTSRWPKGGVDFRGKRVGLIGTGSTGIQATPVIAAEADQLTVFQRTPNFTIPARHAAFAPADQAEIKKNYAEIFQRTRESPAGFPYFPIERSTHDVSAEEREEILEGLWEEGGFKFLWGGFSDLLIDPAANELASEFVRNKIREIVKDPETAELLCPKCHPYGSKRPPIDTDYYVTFNRDNVNLVDIKSAPIEEITSTGLRTTETEYEFDVLVYATGFDAMTGSLLRIDIEGAGGLRLADAWADGPRTFLGIQVAGFPNLFTITGPGSPSVLINMPVAIEHHVDWIADCITHMKEAGKTRVEATPSAQDSWVEHVAEVSEYSLLGTGNSWYVGANIPGKPRVVSPYTGGQPLYRERCEAVVNSGYEGMEFGA